MFGDPVPALKATLAQLIVERVSGWSQSYAADFLGTDQPVDGTIEFDVTWSSRREYLFSQPKRRER